MFFNYSVTANALVSKCKTMYVYAVSALLSPKIPIPANAETKHRRREFVISRLSPKSCSDTIAMIPAVTANMHP